MLIAIIMIEALIIGCLLYSLFKDKDNYDEE